MWSLQVGQGQWVERLSHSHRALFFRFIQPNQDQIIKTVDFRWTLFELSHEASEPVMASSLGVLPPHLLRAHLQLRHEAQHLHRHPPGGQESWLHVVSKMTWIKLFPDEQQHKHPDVAAAKLFSNILGLRGSSFDPWCFLLWLCRLPGAFYIKKQQLQKLRCLGGGWPRCTERRRCLDTGLLINDNFVCRIFFCASILRFRNTVL